MIRTQLQNKFLKERNEKNKKKYSKQRNYCIPFMRKCEMDYFANPDEKNVNDDKIFWKTINPLYRIKHHQLTTDTDT